MFEEYLQDSYQFLVIAQEAAKDSDIRQAKRYYRGAIFYAASAMEAFVNYLGDSFEKANSLTAHETAFLNDKQLMFNPKKGEVVEQTRYHSIGDKLRFLIHKFVKDFDFVRNAYWRHFMEFRDLRDSLVHPRQNEDEIEVTDYEVRLVNGLTGIIQLMNVLSVGIFKRPLRKQILDLIPE